jgi:hypothetical protein
MPKINADDLQQKNLQNDNYGYSHVGLKELGATEYTLVTVVCDRSGSVGPYVDDLTKCLKEIIKACKYSPRADNLMIRLVSFGDDVTEIHGFKLLSACNEADYDTAIKINGCTALYDAAANAVNATSDWGRELIKKDYQANGVIVVITDGCNNAGVFGIGEVKKSLADATQTEALESLVSILVAVNGSGGVNQILDDFHKKAGFTQFVEIGQATAKALAKLAAFVSKSISSQSQALGSGSVSKPLTF